MTPGITEIYRATEATWPPARTWRLGCWTLRDGAGGGKRVSAATAEGPAADTDIAQAEGAMRERGQAPLFMIRKGDDRLDAALAARGYALVDPVTAYCLPVDRLAAPSPPMTSFAIYPPLHIMKELWRDGGIGAERLAVMDRVKGPKTAILARIADRAAGTAFVAMHERIAMLHALEVNEKFRRKGVGALILRRAALWAQDQGAESFALVTTGDNLPSNRLYASLKMGIVGHYHYRGGQLAEG